jgi:hypothetical protein
LIKVKQGVRHLCDRSQAAVDQKCSAEAALPKQRPSGLPRISLLATLAAIAVVGLGSFLMVNSREDAQPAELAVIYVGADDCGPCVAWRRAYRPQFLASREFPQLRYREIISPKLLDLSNDELWPEGLGEVRREFNRFPGAPMWLVVRNDRILVTARGLREWHDVVLPQLSSLAR